MRTKLTIRICNGSTLPRTLFAAVLMLAGVAAWAQDEPMSVTAEQLKFQAPTGESRNLVQIRMPESRYQTIVTSQGEKLELNEAEFSFNGTALVVKEVHLRGNTSLYLPRKSFSVDLAKKHTFLTKPLKDFYLISLSMDKNYFRNHLAFDLMHEAQLLNLFYCYTEVKINDASQGIYLMVQRPQDYALKDVNSPMVIRRGYNQKIDKYKTDKQLPKDSVKTFNKRFRNMYKLCRQYEGEELYWRLGEVLDVPMYMRWMAFNYFVRNGDYTDEVYFYVHSGSGSNVFKIIPWDYDDIFRMYPHEGKDNVNPSLENKLIFSGEDKLDLTIAQDPVLYQKYLQEFGHLLDLFSDTFIHRTFEESYQQLYPYFTDQAVIAQSEKDPSGLTDINKLKSELSVIYTNLIFTRKQCQQAIEESALVK